MKQKIFMKKTIRLIAIFALILTFFLTGNVYAASLNNVTSNVNKQIVRPGEEVEVTINFGEQLGAAILNVSYDNRIFDYVSVDSGTANDQGNRVRVEFHDTHGGTNPINSMTIKFRAKADITTSNPTEFIITGESFAGPTGNPTYDNIDEIVEEVTVEPEYQDYVIDLNYTGDIIANEEKDVKLSYSSSMGRYYEHARIEADATTPEGGTVKLIGINADTNSEEDLILSGFGDPQGYPIGGKDFSQTLNLKALFSKEGDYTVTFRLINRDGSDSTIAQKTITLNAKKTGSQETPEETNNEKNKPATKTEKKAKPKAIAKAGSNIYLEMLALASIFIGAIIYYNKKNKNS